MPVMHIHSMETGGRALSTVASHCSCDKYLSTVSECLAIPVCLRELLTTSSGGGGRRAAPLERQAAENPYAAGVVSRPAPGSRRCSFASEQGCTYGYRDLE